VCWTATPEVRGTEEGTVIKRVLNFLCEDDDACDESNAIRTANVGERFMQMSVACLSRLIAKKLKNAAIGLPIVLHPLIVKLHRLFLRLRYTRVHYLTGCVCSVSLLSSFKMATTAANEKAVESLARRLRINFYAAIYRRNAAFYFSAAQFLTAA